MVTFLKSTIILLLCLSTIKSECDGKTEDECKNNPECEWEPEHCGKYKGYCSQFDGFISCIKDSSNICKYVDGKCKNICLKENVTEEECKNNNKCEWEKTDKGYCDGEDPRCVVKEEDFNECKYLVEDQGKNCKWVELGNCFYKSSTSPRRLSSSEKKCEDIGDFYECKSSNKCDRHYGYCTNNENGDSEECSKFNKIKSCKNSAGCKWHYDYYDNRKCFTKNGCDGESVASINCDLSICIL